MSVCRVRGKRKYQHVRDSGLIILTSHVCSEFFTTRAVYNPGLISTHYNFECRIHVRDINNSEDPSDPYNTLTLFATIEAVLGTLVFSKNTTLYKDPLEFKHTISQAVIECHRRPHNIRI